MTAAETRAMCEARQVRPVIAPNDRVSGDDGRTIHLIAMAAPYGYGQARPLCRRNRGMTVWDPATGDDIDERPLCPKCVARAKRGVRGPGRPSTGVKVQVRIPADLLADIDAEAAQAGVSRAEIIRQRLTD